MMNATASRLRGALMAGALLISTVIAPSASGEMPLGETESQQTARTLLLKMSEYLSGADRFSVEIVASHEVVQESGQKIEFGDIVTVSVDRPKLMVVEFEASDGAAQRITFDGINVTIAHEQAALYAQTQQPGSIDETIVHFVRDLGMRLPLAPIFMQRLPDELKRRVESVDYVEFTSAFAKPAHHIAARTATVDFQVWIADGDQPVPLKLVLTYPNAAGQPSFRAEFAEWNFAPKFPADTFTFEPAKDAEKIPFASDLPALAGEPTKTEGDAQ